MCEEVSAPDQEIPNLKEHAKYYGVKVYDQNCAELGYFHKIGGTYHMDTIEISTHVQHYYDKRSPILLFDPTVKWQDERSFLASLGIH